MPVSFKGKDQYDDNQGASGTRSPNGSLRTRGVVPHDLSKAAYRHGIHSAKTRDGRDMRIVTRPGMIRRSMNEAGQSRTTCGMVRFRVKPTLRALR